VRARDKSLTIVNNMRRGGTQMTKLEVKKQQVYYDPRTELLFTRKGVSKGRIVVNGGAVFYNDAQTDRLRYSISK